MVCCPTVVYLFLCVLFLFLPRNFPVFRSSFSSKSCLTPFYPKGCDR